MRRGPTSRKVVWATACTLLMVAGCADGSDPVAAARGEQIRAAAVAAGLDDTVADFLATAARGQTATFHAVFATGPDAQLVVTSRPPDRRVDVVQDGVVVSSQLTLDGTTLSCAPATATEAVRCETVDAFVPEVGVFTDSAVSTLQQALADSADDFTFEITDEDVNGTAATCLRARIKAGHERAGLSGDDAMCISTEGVLLLVDRADEHLEALEYSTTIDPADLRRPDDTVG